ncbi:hypothetical protein AVEN_87472-1 [Araneus ventricosus]|uniref:Uncharacterized protein n=1 Tax=Araneus ventricosus TaxID=182803 RepID=A0A4Y2SB06_ARAVE|nr:hypothetical protein AVEN_87472-1 [Araneus ventricosus]
MDFVEGGSTLINVSTRSRPSLEPSRGRRHDLPLLLLQGQKQKRKARGLEVVVKYQITTGFRVPATALLKIKKRTHPLVRWVVGRLGVEESDLRLGWFWKGLSVTIFHPWVRLLDLWRECVV